LSRNRIGRDEHGDADVDGLVELDGDAARLDGLEVVMTLGPARWRTRSASTSPARDRAARVLEHDLAHLPVGRPSRAGPVPRRPVPDRHGGQQEELLVGSDPADGAFLVDGVLDELLDGLALDLSPTAQSIEARLAAPPERNPPPFFS
jgi:hypothetical protein